MVAFGVVESVGVLVRIWWFSGGFVALLVVIVDLVLV